MFTQDAESRWFAVRVRSQKEKLTALALRNQGYQELLPLYRSKRRWSDRIKEIELPLFPGYVFCRFDPKNRLPILTTLGVLHVVGIRKTPVPVDDNEIAAVQAIVKSGLPALPWGFRQIGQGVRIIAGPLHGLEGILLECKKGQRLVVSVTLLQRSVAVEIDYRWITPIGPVRWRPSRVMASDFEFQTTYA